MPSFKANIMICVSLQYKAKLPTIWCEIQFV